MPFRSVPLAADPLDFDEVSGRCGARAARVLRSIIQVSEFGYQQRKHRQAAQVVQGSGCGYSPQGKHQFLAVAVGRLSGFARPQYVPPKIALGVHANLVFNAGIGLVEGRGLGAAAKGRFELHVGVLNQCEAVGMCAAAGGKESAAKKPKKDPKHALKVMYLRHMNIISWNVNGLRAVAGKGLHGIIRDLNPDVMGFQEIKCTVDQAKEVLGGLGYHVVAHEAEKKGYSGTALISKAEPLSVAYGMGVEEHEGEGRVITAEFDDVFVVTTYVPNSKGDLSRIPQRARWDRDLTAYLEGLDARKPVVLCGDLNVAHKPIDLSNPQSNYNKTPGYTQSEIDGFQYLLDAGFADSWREQNPGVAKYSWWSMRSGARAKNIGWRLDYHVVSRRLMDSVASTEIHAEVHGSDHCPVRLVLG